jgi:hypothetical protein
VVLKSLEWVKLLGITDVLALHLFGEPLLHPKFDEIALRFSELVPITMSTNAVLLDEAWADRLARIAWKWISLSPWDEKSRERASLYFEQRKIHYMYPGAPSHDWAGQAKGPNELSSVNGCPFLRESKAVIRWNGDMASCCITDREEDVIGTVWDNPKTVLMRGYSLCQNCHHNR